MAETDVEVDCNNRKKREEKEEKTDRREERSCNVSRRGEISVYTESIDKDDEKGLRDLEAYHGFLPREDLYLLKNEGDYLIRVSERDQKDPSLPTRKEIILSIMSIKTPKTANPDDLRGEDIEQSKRGKGTTVRNLVIAKSSAGYSLDKSKPPFPTMRELEDYYKKTQFVLDKNGVGILLKNAITRQKWEYAHSDVKLDERKLGEGAFGEVRSGILKRKNKEDRPVAVKMMRGTTDLGKAQIKELMKEARIMQKFQHPNVLKLYGVAVLEQPLYIILELIEDGELLKYLKKTEVGGREKYDMCLGAAKGLEHIHSVGIIHRDIAARNCLYSMKSRLVKISDFGLSRPGPDYKMRTPKKVPIKWLAPETLLSSSFSFKTDVYMYGVLVYEIYSNGHEPWENCTNMETKRNVVEGKKLDLPDCPPQIKEFVSSRIYVKEPSDRAAMSEVVKHLESLQSILPAEPVLKPEVSTMTTNVEMPVAVPEKSAKSVKKKKTSERTHHSTIAAAPSKEGKLRNVRSHRRGFHNKAKGE